MEEMEEAMGGPKDLTTNIVKGKRTKRQRPHSPIPFFIPSLSDSTEENNDDDDEDIYNPSPSEFDEEEEDMANCLILLAQGHYLRPEDHHQYVSKRYTSKRFIESDGKEGVCVYQCKTCDRVFPSFQALGGHRASHKKPKGGMIIEEKKIQRQSSFLSSDCVDEGLIGERKEKLRTVPINLLMQLPLLDGNNSKPSPKIHECGICGEEFSSGQALGGHMRRHRVAMGTNSVPTTRSLTLAIEFDSEPDKELSEIKMPKNLISLDLDLNLPAPADEEKQQKHKQQQEQNQNHNQNQSCLVLSAGTFVDRHY